MKPYIFMLLLFSVQVRCQSNIESNNGEISAVLNSEKIEVQIHARVDTTKTEVKEIAKLWINYLNSEPDKISNNPFWNEEEKQLYRDFDFSRNLMFQFPADQLLRHYNPQILSIEKEGDYYGIRTIFSADGLEGEYKQSNPWCIHKIYAVREGGGWKLKNSLPIITADWNAQTIGKITFKYPPNHTFDFAMAQKANEFCVDLAKEFQFPEWEPFSFYITKSGDELGKLLNFDFFFAGYTTGIGMNEKRILLSGLGSEYYPHEFIHLILPKLDRHPMIEEGFATWKGGQGGKTFEESARNLAIEIAKNDTITFSDVLQKKWGWHVAAFYTSGAILCKAAYEKGGIDLVKELLSLKNNNVDFVSGVATLFDIEPNEFNSFWRKEVLKYQHE